MRARFVLSLLGLALCGAVPWAAAAGTGPQPLAVQSASLTQAGQQLVWRVTMAAPFSPGALKAAGRSLCLLLERHRTGTVSGRLCLIGPRAGASGARLVYQTVTRAGVGRAAVITATVTPDGAHGLSATFDPSAFGLGYAPLRWQVLSTLRSPPCQPTSPGSDSCVTLFPERPASTSLHTPQLVGCVDSGSPFVNHGPRIGHMIALTFDDGPWYQTAQFLTLLERYRVPATFFEVGVHVAGFGQGGAIERRMLADGDMIGDHTWNHADVSAGGPFAAGEISQTAEAIKQATHGFTPCLFRAPFGAVGPGLLRTATSLGFKTIQWDIDPRDWATPGVGAIYGNVMSNAHPGAIILQHDGGGNRAETLAALPREIKSLKARGYRFVTITQLLGMKLLYH
ncbi:MAG: polysaccharide deacetylase family protein [Solirubrobacteraceae bacterium]